jgi:hypothetical protein
MQKISIDQLMDDSYELGLEKILSKDTNYRYLPWVGSEFSLQSKKIMVVAESVYLWGNNTEEIASSEKIALQPDFGRIVLYEQGLDFDHNFKPKDKPMFPNFMKAYTGEKHIVLSSKVEFWKSVVFHELVQTPMLNLETRPTKKDFIIGAKYLGEVAQLLMPNTIVIFGTDWREKYVPIKKAFENLQYKIVSENFFDGSKINRSYPRVLTFSKCGNEVRILFMKHPSGRGGFSPNLWHSFLSENI